MFPEPRCKPLHRPAPVAHASACSGELQFAVRFLAPGIARRSCERLLPPLLPRTALDGITTLDPTRPLPGAVATQWLADFGAQVIKIEQPGIGDYARHNFTGQGDNPIFALTNRGKKSL